MPYSSKQLASEFNLKLKDVLAEKYLLFDTCVISRLSKIVSPTREIFDFLHDINCVPGMTEQIYVECLRDHGSAEAFNRTKEFLLDSPFSSKKLTVDRVSNFYEKMLLIDRVNQNNGYKGRQVSFVDLTIAVFLQHWPESLFLATFNIKDFCHKIFDIIYVMPLVCNEELLLLGIIKANAERFKVEKGKIEKTLRKNNL